LVRKIQKWPFSCVPAAYQTVFELKRLRLTAADHARSTSKDDRYQQRRKQTFWGVTVRVLAARYIRSDLQRSQGFFGGNVPFGRYFGSHIQ
jgi:hypothetical protein